MFGLEKRKEKPVRWKEATIHVIDFEGRKDYGIVEYGAATLEGGKIARTATRVCRAAGEVAADDVKRHGLRRRDTEDSAPFAEEWEAFVARRRSGPFCAHHAAFENHLLKSLWPYPPFVPDFQRPGGQAAEWGPWIDTRRLFERHFPGLDSYKLSSLVEYFYLKDDLEEQARRHCPPERSRFHCALYDALAAALLLLDFIWRAETGEVSLAWLLKESMGAEKRSGAEQGELFE